MNLLIAWILLTVPVVYVATLVSIFFYEEITFKSSSYSNERMHVAMYLLWWGIYFLFK